MGNSRLQTAVAWATELHFGQFRDGVEPVPYICHPLEVLTCLRYVGQVTDVTMLCTAVLHDVIEETGATEADVAQKVGGDVAKLVAELTRVEPSPEETAGMTKDQVWELRAGLLLEEIAGMSPQAMVVKMCDRISNLREARYAKSPKKFERYLRQSEKILKVIPRRHNPRLWDTLKGEVARGR